jgi:hypothetical protein
MRNTRTADKKLHRFRGKRRGISLTRRKEVSPAQSRLLLFGGPLVRHFAVGVQELELRFSVGLYG